MHLLWLSTGAGSGSGSWERAGYWWWQAESSLHTSQRPLLSTWHAHRWNSRH